MSIRRIELKDFAKELGQFSETFIKENKQAFANGVAESIPDLVRASPVDTGLYAQSWDMAVTEDSVTVGNYSPHAPIIEDGARPHYPPIGPLLAWAKRKLQDGSQKETGYSPEVWRLAKGVQAKIAREGQKPMKILTNATPMIYERVREALKVKNNE
jgi:hypothetical protein